MANTSSFTPEQLAELQQLFIDFFQKNGSALGEGQVRELTPEELTSETLEALTIPSMMPSTEEWVQTSLTNMMGPLNTSKAAADAATQNANNAASAANTAVTYAERVNATMDGMEITVIDRNGVSITKNIGFDMVGTYGSIAEMKADAADVEEGKFVIIATDDPTATDNAKLFVRNSNAATSQNPFSFCADLDQASAAAWADWLDNMKPQIEAAISTAAADHTRAEGDHTTAGTDHGASVEATNAANAEADRAKGYNDHPWEIGNDGYIYVWNETTQTMVRTNKMIIDFDDLTDEQIQEMIDLFYETLVFATKAESESAANELT